jgi:Ribosomal large subunit proteins 60S L5, and 50S L18
VGEDYNVDEADDGPRPFTALLDTGLKRTSTGSKVFAALKVGVRAGSPQHAALLRPEDVSADWRCCESQRSPVCQGFIKHHQQL